ncbi:MAG: CHASE3 domain-containing protein, partial [Euzebyales bacterium]|nr:CHASE3 domain-containing protein [Euzebyales bacterium]
MTSRRRISLLIGAFLLLLASNTAFAAVGVTARDRLSANAVRYSRAGDDIRALLADYVDQETGVRGFVITGDDSLLDPYRRGRRAADARLGELAGLLAGHTALRRQLRQVGLAARAWQRDAAEPEISAVQQGRQREAGTLVASGTGRRLFGVLR